MGRRPRLIWHERDARFFSFPIAFEALSLERTNEKFVPIILWPNNRHDWMPNGHYSRTTVRTDEWSWTSVPSDSDITSQSVYDCFAIIQASTREINSIQQEHDSRYKRYSIATLFCMNNSVNCEIEYERRRWPVRANFTAVQLLFHDTSRSVPFDVD